MNLDLSEKQYAAAMDRVQKQIEKDATLAQLWGLRAKIYWAQQDVTRAEADLLKAIELDPKLEPAYLLLAQLYVSSNRQDQAIEKLNGFVEKNKTVPALLQLAEIQEQVKNFPAARDAYEKLLTVSADFVPALNNLAVLYSEHLGQARYCLRPRKERASLPRMIPTMPIRSAGSCSRRATTPTLCRCCRKRGQGDGPDIQFHLGMAHYMLGDEVLARAALQKAADASADFPGKRSTTATRFAGDRRWNSKSGTRTELEDVLRQWPNDPAALIRLAQLQLRDGDTDQAVKTLEKALPTIRSMGPRSGNSPSFTASVRTMT